VGKRRFGVSTSLYQRLRLGREHLLEVASYGFDTVEVLASRPHVDYRNPAVVADLQQWLAEAGLDLEGVAVPAAAPEDEAEQALFVARRIPLKTLVVHAAGPAREAARTVGRLAALARPLGVTVAVDSRSDGMSPIGSLVHFVDSVEDAEVADGPERAGSNAPSVGIALDVATARKQGDLLDAIDLVSEHLVAVRIPIDGAIDWASALTSIQKVGYDGALIFDPAPAGSAKETLARARKARDKMERWLTSI
jgi:sugar phosphate isomerase/epimerase